MNRYLLEVSYIGTRFRGIQKTVNKLDIARLDTTTVQGCLELALQVFRPVNEIQTVLSSRTDSGVHALHSTLHVDLESHSGEPYDVCSVTGVLNRTLDKQSLPIRVLRTTLVPDTFHCRFNALGRSYLYRIAVAKDGTENPKNKNFEEYLPVEELDRCYFLQNSKFNLDRLKEASRMFLGYHDFRTFTSVSRQKSPSRDHPRFTVRRIDDIQLKPGKSLAINPKAEELYNYIDLEIKAKSFLYKQVRRIVGTLLAVATDRISEKYIYEMLTIPSKNTWDPRIMLAPAFGLYLRQVHYNENDLKFGNKSEL